MNTFFTSDTHFNHASIIKNQKNRQKFMSHAEAQDFAEAYNRCEGKSYKVSAESVNRMNEEIIHKWNSVVGLSDTVYHLGDFAWKYHADFLGKLNGLIIFVEGNHDKDLGYSQWQGCKSYFTAGRAPQMRTVKVEGQEIVLCHYSMRTWNKMHYGVWHLYGHSHGSLPDDPNSLSFDVGVDCHDLYPVSFQHVKQIMATKCWKPKDHHI